MASKMAGMEAGDNNARKKNFLEHDEFSLLETSL